MSRIIAPSTAVRFDMQRPQNTPEVTLWKDSGLPQPRDMSAGFVIHPTRPGVRQHVWSGDYIVEFADKDYRVMSPGDYQQWRAEGSNYSSRFTWDIWIATKQARGARQP